MPAERDRTYAQVLIDHLVIGGTRVSWVFMPEFLEPGPYVCRLEVGSTGDPQADDWADCGVEAQNVTCLVDPARHLLGGLVASTHYRVVVATGLAEHVSPPVPVFGTLPKRDWLECREVIRQFRLRNRIKAGSTGWLLKKRFTGVVPQANTAYAPTDYLTGGLLDTQREDTYGTEFAGGYYAPVPFEAALDPAGLDPRRDPSGARGTVDDAATVRPAMVVPYPPVLRNDVVILAGSDYRYYVGRVAEAAERRGVPYLARVELRLAPFSDVIYRYPVPGA